MIRLAQIAFLTVAMILAAADPLGLHAAEPDDSSRSGPAPMIFKD